MLKTYNFKTIRQLKTHYLTLMQKEKQMVCKLSAVPGSGLALLAISDIETWSVLTIKYNTIGRQLASDDKVNKRQRSHQY